MLFGILMLMANNAADNLATPAVSGVVVNHSAGTCDPINPHTIETPATINLAWTLTNPDAALHSIKVYRNGVLLATLSGTATSYFISIDGYVEEGSREFESAWVFSVDVVLTSDGSVISTASAAEFDQWYGTC